jgi:hypothetical protein
VIVAVPPKAIIAGSAEHEIWGGRGSFTVNRALQVATPLGLPSLRLAVTWYEPDCKPFVSICVELPLSSGLTPEPLYLYVTVRFALKFDPSAVALTGSPTQTSLGWMEQLA